VGARKRLDQCRFAMVNVAGSSDDDVFHG
jgi:hypothetical protein